LVTLLVAAAGLYSAFTLERRLTPDLRLQTVAVVVSHPGASPESVCRQLTEPVETALRDLPEVVGVTSTAVTGQSVSLVEFATTTDLEAARLRLVDLLANLARGWPEQVSSQVTPLSADDQPDAQVAVFGSATDSPDPGLMAQVARDLVLPRLTQIEQVRTVVRSGATDNVITVTLRPAALAQYGLDAAQVVSVLRDLGLTGPGGVLSSGDRSVAVQLGAPVTTVDELRAVPLRVIQSTPSSNPTRSTPAPSPTVTTVTLSMVAEVALGPSPAESRARSNGRPAVLLTVVKTERGDFLDLSQALAETVRQLNPTLAQSGLTAQVVFDQAPFLERTTDWLARDGLIGWGVCLLVVLVGLLSLRSALVAAVAWPIALLGGLTALRLTGASLNLMTLAGLAVALGRTVDDSLVVLENVKRHLAYGQPKRAAIVSAVREVAGPIAATTAATGAVMAPLAIWGGLAGQLGRPFVLALAAALSSSLLVSLAVVPVLCQCLLKASITLDAEDADRRHHNAEARRRQGLGQRAYLGLLRPTLRHPVVTVALALLAMGGAAWLGRGLETGFLNSDGRDTLLVTQVFPPDSSLPAQDAQASRVEDALLKLDFVRTVQTTVGGPSIPTQFNPTGQPQATFSVTVRPEAAAEAAQSIQLALSGLGSVTEPVAVSEPAWRDTAPTVDLIVRAPDQASLTVGLELVRDMVQGLDRTGPVSSPETVWQDLVQVTVDRQRTVEAGLTEAQVTAVVAAATQPARIGALASGSTVIDVLVALGQAPSTVEELAELPLGDGPAGPLRLGQLASIETVSTPAVITTDQGQRSATVRLSPAAADLPHLLSQLEPALERLQPQLPPGSTVRTSGLADLSSQSWAGIGLALLAGLVVAYGVMVLALRGPLTPVVPLLALPFSLGGGLVGLLLGGAPVGLPALVGGALLIGLAASNTLVSVNLVNQSRQAGLDLDEALLEGTRQRLRPVLTTACAIAAAMLPLTIGLDGPDADPVRSLAHLVLGGLVASTLFTLLVAPACHSLVARQQDRQASHRQSKLDKARADRSNRLGLDLPQPRQPERPDGLEESTVVLRRRSRKTRAEARTQDSAPSGGDQSSGAQPDSEPVGPSPAAAAVDRNETAGPLGGGPRSSTSPTVFASLDRLGGSLRSDSPDRLDTPAFYDQADRFGLGGPLPPRPSTGATSPPSTQPTGPGYPPPTPTGPGPYAPVRPPADWTTDPSAVFVPARPAGLPPRPPTGPPLGVGLDRSLSAGTLSGAGASPSAPTDPRPPTGSYTPTGSYIPAGSYTPTGPYTPAGSYRPTGPRTPASPYRPTDPPAPTSPYLPTDPRSPAQPRTPAGPSAPASPYDPAGSRPPAGWYPPADPYLPTGLTASSTPAGSSPYRPAWSPAEPSWSPPTGSTGSTGGSERTAPAGRPGADRPLDQVSWLASLGQTDSSYLSDWNRANPPSPGPEPDN
jgi:HAE1 family hydrophobic/amphiphilic exporter-1